MGVDIHFYVEAKKNGKWLYQDSADLQYKTRNRELFHVLQTLGDVGENNGELNDFSDYVQEIVDEESNMGCRQQYYNLNIEKLASHKWTDSLYDSWFVGVLVQTMRELLNEYEDVRCIYYFE